MDRSNAAHTPAELQKRIDASYVLDWLKQTDAPENIVALQEKVVEAAGGYISGADRVRPW